jgi:hypothetical protein
MLNKNQTLHFGENDGNILIGFDLYTYREIFSGTATDVLNFIRSV